MFTTTTIAHTAFAAYALYRTFRRDQVDEEDRTDFRTLGLARTNTPESYVLDPRSSPEAYTLEEEDELPPMPTTGHSGKQLAAGCKKLLNGL